MQVRFEDEQSERDMGDENLHQHDLDYILLRKAQRMVNKRNMLMMKQRMTMNLDPSMKRKTHFKSGSSILLEDSNVMKMGKNDSQASLSLQ